MALFESTLTYVGSSLDLDLDVKGAKPYGLWAEKKPSVIKFKDPIFAPDEEEDDDADATFAAKSTAGQSPDLASVWSMLTRGHVPI